MASGDVDIQTPQQIVLTKTLSQIARVRTNRRAISIPMVVCSFTNSGCGYDLKFRPASEATDPKHFQAASRTAGKAKLAAGAREFLAFKVKPNSDWIIEASAESVASIAVTTQIDEEKIT